MARCAAVAALLAGLVLTVGAVEKVRVFGDRYRHPSAPTEFVRTYVDMPKDHDGDTMPLAVGVQITYGFSRLADELPMKEYVIPMMEGPFNYTTHENFGMRFPEVGTNPYKFSTWSYNLFGHPPLGVFDYQHYDVRFFFPDMDQWWAEWGPDSFGPCNGAAASRFLKSNIPLPKDCYPGGLDSRIQSVGNFVWGQGTHLYDMKEAIRVDPTFQDVESFVWGMYNGSINFNEVMISRSKALDQELEDCRDLTDVVPKHFDTERTVATEVCWLGGDNAHKIELRKFVKVPGGCQEERNAAEELHGHFPLPILKNFMDPACKLPEGAGQ